VLNYTLHSKQDMANSLQKAIDEGKIKIYSDSALKNLLSYSDYYTRIETRIPVQIPNPMNPDDIYDLIDTFIYETEYSSDLAILDNGSVEWVNARGFKIYISYKHFKKLLDARLVTLLEYFKFNGLKEMNNKSLEPFCQQLVKTQGITLFNYGINKQLTAYTNDSLTTTYTPDEITERVATIENKQYQNPKNPNDIYDLIDSTFVYDFNPDTIKILRVHFYWANKKNTTEAKFFAIAHYSILLSQGLNYRQHLFSLLSQPTI